MLVEDNLFNMKSLTEEQKRMRELMGFTYKDNSHDILSEQNIEKSLLSEQTKEEKKRYKQMWKNKEISRTEYKNLKRGGVPNWEGKSNGLIKWDVLGSQPNAEGVTESDWNLYSARGITRTGETPPITGSTSDTPPITWELPEIELLGDGSIPFADNMVTPAWDKFPTAKSKFDEVVTSFIEFIKQGGFDYIKKINIQGSADSARPTEDVPAGYSGLDHPDGIYGGETDDTERNQYLADMRAKMYAADLIEAVKEATGKDLSNKFVYLKGLNYYGSEGKERGPNYRKITFTIEADDIPGTKGKIGGEVKYSFLLGEIKGGDTVLLVKLPGYDKKVPVIRNNSRLFAGDLFIPSTDQIDPLTNETIPYTKILQEMIRNKGMGKVEIKGGGTKMVKQPGMDINGEMKLFDRKIKTGGDFYVDGKYVGFLRKSETGEFDTGANDLEKYTYVVGDKKQIGLPYSTIWATTDEKRGDLIKISNIWFGLRPPEKPWGVQGRSSYGYGL